MAVHVWLVEGSKLILNVAEILKVPALETIYREWHTDREIMYKIFKFIDAFSNEDGYIKRNGLTEIKAFEYACDVAGLPRDFKPTKNMAEAISWLIDHNINFVGNMFFASIEALQSSRELVNIMNKNLRNDLKKDSFNKEEIASMLGYVKEITKLASDIPALIEKLQNTENAYNKSKLKATIVRGGRTMAASMDPNNGVDNGGSNEIDIID